MLARLAVASAVVAVRLARPALGTRLPLLARSGVYGIKTRADRERGTAAAAAKHSSVAQVALFDRLTTAMSELAADNPGMTVTRSEDTVRTASPFYRDRQL